MILVWKYLPSLRDDAFFDSWVTRILINASRRILRNSRPHRHVELPEEVAAPPEQDHQALQDALSALDDKYKTPIVRYHLEGYPIHEIAEMLGAPIGTIKSRLSRGRVMLRIKLKEEEEE